LVARRADLGQRRESRVRTATWSWPGSEAAIQGVRPSQWQVYDRNIALEDRVQTVLGWLAQTGAQAPRLATLYMENVDKAGHTYRPESAEYREAIQRADTIVGQVREGLDARGLASDTNIVLLSDHGMGELPEGHVLDTERMVDPTVAVATSVGQPVAFQARPGRAGRTIEGFDNVDVYPLLARLLNGPASANDPDTFDAVLRRGIEAPARTGAAQALAEQSVAEGLAQRDRFPTPGQVGALMSRHPQPGIREHMHAGITAGLAGA